MGVSENGKRRYLVDRYLICLDYRSDHICYQQSIFPKVLRQGVTGMNKEEPSSFGGRLFIGRFFVIKNFDISDRIYQYFI
jgi:hypothetical protein